MFLVEGNIGAGKSTFLQLIKNKLPHLDVIFEPVNVWQTAEHGKSLLQNFYTDTPRWAYTMESFTLINRIFENNKTYLNNHPIAERSIYSGYYCFAKNSYENSFMTKLEWNIYEQWFYFLTNHDSYHTPSGFIYLRTCPKVAYKRIIKRNRLAEKLISLDYINQIHQRHEDLLIIKHQSAHLVNVPVLVLDANLDFENNPDEFDKMIEKLQLFIIDASQNKQNLGHPELTL